MGYTACWAAYVTGLTGKTLGHDRDDCKHAPEGSQGKICDKCLTAFGSEEMPDVSTGVSHRDCQLGVWASLSAVAHEVEHRSAILRARGNQHMRTVMLPRWFMVKGRSRSASLVVQVAAQGQDLGSQHRQPGPGHYSEGLSVKGLSD